MDQMSGPTAFGGPTLTGLDPTVTPLTWPPVPSPAPSASRGGKGYRTLPLRLTGLDRIRGYDPTVGTYGVYLQNSLESVS